MIIPSKYQLSNENDPDNSLRVNNITKKYTTCLKKFGNSCNNKILSNSENQGYFFQKKVIEWFFNLSFIDRVKVSSINNKWAFQTLHQLYLEQKKKNNLKFIPRITEQNIPFMQNLKGRDFFSDNPGHFLNYFAFCSEKYELINGYDENLEKEFLNEVVFMYPDITKTSKINMKDNATKKDFIFLNKFYYPVFTLSESILTNQDKFLNFFKKMTNNNFFTLPPEVINPNKQKEIRSDKMKDNNNIMNSLNNLKINYNNTNNNNLNDIDLNNNTNNNNNYNNKIQNIIDLPLWAKQPAKSRLCFSVNEIFLAFFEQNIAVYYILFLYDNHFYKEIMNDKINTDVKDYILLRDELKDFLSLNKENFLELLNIDLITKEIYYNSFVEKFVDGKKYESINLKTKFWKDYKGYDTEYNLIKNYFNEFNNDNKSMIRLINDITIFNIEQIYTYEDFFLNQVFFNLYKKYDNNKQKDILSDLLNESPKEEEKKKKKKKKNKNKKKKEKEEAQNSNSINNINININISNDSKNKNENNKIIEIKKFIVIEEDEELSKIKKGYAKLDSNDSNLCESSGSENNCDSKPLLANDDFKQVMKDKENLYNSKNDNLENNENDLNNNNNEKNKIENNKEDSDNNNIKSEKNNKEENIIINNDEDEKKENEEKEEKEDNNNENNIKENKIDINEDNKKESENKMNTINNNNINNNKKKKGNNFFLYPTIKKANNDKINKPPFIMKLNEDILSYNKYLLSILDSLSPIKEHIIETIKSHIQQCFMNDNFPYQIEIYGSFKSNLDIVCSDIDMVFIPKKTKNLNICDIILELSNHFSSLNKYDKVTPIYTASIPLIKLMIKYNNYLEENKSLLDNYTKLINSPIYKNYPYDVETELSYVNIDISFPVNYNNKKNKNSPFQQIEFVKSSLSNYVEANIVIRILKRALKLTDMNNSYKGGLSSYTIFLLVISYMKNINKNNNANTKHKSNTYGHAFHDVVKFFSKFDFYANIIDIGNKNGDIYNARNQKYNSSEYDNIPIIIDPVTGLNAGKSTFRINDVQNVFIALNEELEKLRNEYDKNNNNNSKNNKGEDKNNDNDINNLIITLLKNVENNYLNK